MDLVLAQELDELKEACIYDLCATDDIDTILCSHAEALVFRCNDLGGKISNWRTGGFCRA